MISDTAPGSTEGVSLLMEPHLVIPYLINNDIDILKGCESMTTSYWKPFLCRLTELGILQDKKILTPGELSTPIGLFTLAVFSVNLQSVINSYEMYVLRENQLDERIFLRENCTNEIGSFKQKMEDLSLQENSPEKQNGVSKLKPPVTPLTSLFFCFFVYLFVCLFICLLLFR